MTGDQLHAFSRSESLPPFCGLRPQSSWVAEFIVLAAVLVCFAAMATCFSAHGAQHADALMDAETPICILKGAGWTSFAHSQVTPGLPLAHITPAYIITLAAWLYVWGISSASVMSLNCVLIACSSMLLWGFLHRSALVSSRRLRLAMSLLFPMLPGVSAVYQVNRYDSFGLLGLAVASFSLTIKGASSRRFILVVAGLLVGCGGGAHGVIGAAVLACLALVFFGRRAIVEWFVFGFAIALGIGFVVACMVATGTVHTFVTALEDNAVFANRSLAWRLLAPIRGGQESGFFDGYLLSVAVAALSVTMTAGSSWLGRMRTAGMFAAINAIVTPLLLASLGRYSNKYEWLVVGPTLVSASIAIDREIRSRWRSATVAVIATLCAVSGFPSQAFYMAVEWQARDRLPVEMVIARHIRPGDVVYSTASGYYPAKLLAQKAYLISAFKSMTDDQRRAVTLAVIDGRENGRAMFEPTPEEAFASFGGRWREVERITVARGELRQRLLPHPASSCTFNVGIYRRVDSRVGRSASTTRDR